MKKYTMIVDEDYQVFNDNCEITLEEIDLKLKSLKKGLDTITNWVMKNHKLIDELFELSNLDF